ncbi:Rv1733c family protein [Streptomyces griseoluteus]|uniref:Rv1733c family protein n=1 Tax=Streptomyces griseoluteus TaxID=29306 RepID=UPI00368BDDF7
MDRRTRSHHPRRRHNPLRRRSDVVEDCVVVIVAVLLCVVAPLTGTVAGLFTYDRARTHAEEQRAERQPVRAVVAGRPASRPSVHGDRGHVHRAEVRWTEPGRRTRTAVADVRAGTRAGDTVTVWLDSRGRMVAPPPNDVAVWQHTVGIGLGVAGGTAAIVLLARAVERRVALRHRLAEWERAWARTGPAWTRRRA